MKETLLTPVVTWEMVSRGGSKIATSWKAAAGIMFTVLLTSLLERNTPEAGVKSSSKRGMCKLFAMQISTREKTESEIGLGSPVISAGSYIIQAQPKGEIRAGETD